MLSTDLKGSTFAEEGRGLNGEEMDGVTTFHLVFWKYTIKLTCESFITIGAHIFLRKRQLTIIYFEFVLKVAGW